MGTTSEIWTGLECASLFRNPHGKPEVNQITVKLWTALIVQGFINLLILI